MAVFQTFNSLDARSLYSVPCEASSGAACAATLVTKPDMLVILQHGVVETWTRAQARAASKFCECRFSRLTWARWISYFYYRAWSPRNIPMHDDRRCYPGKAPLCEIDSEPACVRAHGRSSRLLKAVVYSAPGLVGLQQAYCLPNVTEIGRA